MSKELKTSRITWTVISVGLVSAVVYCALLCFLSEAIKARKEINMTMLRSVPEILFVLNSMFLGWASIAFSERSLGTTGLIQLFIVIPCWAIGIGGGFGLAAVFGYFPNSDWGLLALCVLVTVLAGAIRVYLPQ